MKTTLAAIRAHGACEDGWEKLLKHLGKTKADDEPLSLRTVLESNGLDYALWCLQAVEGFDREIRLFACGCAERVLPLFEAKYPGDRRPRQAIEVARRYADGKASGDDLAAAGNAAMAAARDAAMGGAWAAARNAARNAAMDAAMTAAMTAAMDAARDAAMDAAMAASGDAVWAAAMAAARNAARGGAAWDAWVAAIDAMDAAMDTAWDAARDAARAAAMAAWVAAMDAERQWQTARFIRLLDEAERQP